MTERRPRITCGNAAAISTETIWPALLLIDEGKQKDHETRERTILIETKALSKRFGTFCALDHLDLLIPHQCIFGLLGPNGAGKSTAIKILTTLLDASSGSATVAGFDVAQSPVEVRRRIGYVPQMLSADGALTARENLVLSASLYGLRGASGRLASMMR